MSSYTNEEIQRSQQGHRRYKVELNANWRAIVRNHCDYNYDYVWREVLDSIVEKLYMIKNMIS